MTALIPQRLADPAGLTAHPRFEERLRALRRRRRRRSIPLLVLVVLTILAILALLIALSPRAAVHQVTITGADQTGPDIVAAVAGIENGTPSVAVDGGAIAARIEQLPWVANARVDRTLSGEVSIRVIERVPVATVGYGAQRMAVDRDGRILARADDQLAVPSIGGLRPADTVGETVRDRQRTVAALVATLPTEVTGQLLSIRDDGEGLRAIRADGITIELGDDTEIRAKFDAVAAALTAYDPSQVAAIDVRVPNAVAVTTTLRADR